MKRVGWAALRVELARQRGGRARGRYSEAVRARVGAEVRQARQRGERWRAIAAGLGVSLESVRRWAAAGGSFRAVEVVADGPGGARESGSAASLILVTRSGHRVEGLDLCGMARLLREIA